MATGSVVYEGDTEFNHYQIVDGMYDGRPARVLYSGEKQAAQSGVAHDEEPDLLFDYIQRFFELAMNLTPEKVLVIGGGAFTLPMALLYALPDVKVDVVEPDGALRSLAEKYFGLPKTDRMRHFETDGRSFLNGTGETYDMIFVDAFTHTRIPRSLATLEATRMLRRHLKPNGVAAMNVISSYHGRGSQTIRSLYAAYAQVFTEVDIFYASRGYTLWLPQNFILTGQVRGSLPLKDYIRHKAVTPPEAHPDEVRHDA